MKKSFLFPFSFMLLLGLSMINCHEAEASPHFGVNFQVFYNELSPYGDWVMDPNYGYVWIPFVERGFQPYASNGYWTMTNFGNTWVSDYAWGWAPFHYGRWFWSNFYGWAWVPGYEWGPAWVNWRTGGGYYGWAPLGPGIGINVSFHAPMSHWVFVPQRRFRHRNFYRYYVPSFQIANIYQQSIVINNTYIHNNQTYIAGPSRREVERVTRSRVPVYQVNDSNRPGRTVVNNNSLNVYRPQITGNEPSKNPARPSRVYTAEEYKHRSASQMRSTRSTESISGQVVNPGRNNNAEIRTSGRTASGNPSINRPTGNPSSSYGNERLGQQKERFSNAGMTNRGTQPKASNSSNMGKSPAVNSRENMGVNHRAASTNGTTYRQAKPANQQRSPASVGSKAPTRQNQPLVKPQSNPPRNSGTTVSRNNSNGNAKSATSSRGNTRGGH
ncbi:hypothetical protein SAMN00777080_2647 [Aquiflexum balticum DSM 16537]|uniref:YXWGXW repeat-containing protein n=1 Tax=Aquiflexum balticum DSM 16537 TaxID=758820 RepID=A0A1W2H5W7_9BACT|nr:DUF6600 domain-containing protein [Aquiflexum balticum]SMD44032.1 hypothetical protein SAMN00777080_2647 [Aquiflexum balticum DSM 16537]